MVAVFLAGFGVLMGAASAQFSKPEDAIKYRKSVMFIMAQHFGRLGAMVKGAQPYDQDTFTNNAAIVDTISKLPWEAFLVAGSDRGSTKMKSSVLKNPDEFKKIAQQLQQSTDGLLGAAADNGLAAVKGPFGAVAKNCKECHGQFRK